MWKRDHLPFKESIKETPFQTFNMATFGKQPTSRNRLVFDRDVASRIPCLAQCAFDRQVLALLAGLCNLWIATHHASLRYASDLQFS